MVMFVHRPTAYIVKNYDVAQLQRSERCKSTATITAIAESPT